MDALHDGMEKKKEEACGTSYTQQGKTEAEEETRAGKPHEALLFVLAYLPLFELLSMSEVCVSLRNAVSKDVLPWLDLVVGSPLNLRICDEVLQKVTAKAMGRLRSLVLVNCVKITDDGLQRVVEQNPLLNKLYVPGCTTLTPEGVIRAVRTLSNHPRSCLKSLRVNGIYNIKAEHLQELHSHLQANPSDQERQPSLYNHRMHFPKSESNQSLPAIDMEVCPKCREIRAVFDCPRKECKAKNKSSCRGCILCIPRCEECGGCVDDEEQEETVCVDVLCFGCWLKLPKCSFCNRPYCLLHASRMCSFPDSGGSLCDFCSQRLVRYSTGDCH